MVTVKPVPDDVGVNDVMVGAATQVKLVDDVPVWLLVLVTVMLPVVPAPTTAVIWVELTTLNEVAAVPPNLTALIFTKLVPVMVTVIPLPAEVGVNDEMVGVAPNAVTTNKLKTSVNNGRVLPMLDRI